jgi:hypothetical protein
MVTMPNFLCLDSSCRMSEAGVMGYAPRKIGRRDLTLAATRPSARAALPVTLRYVPGAILAGLTSYRTAKSSVVSPKFQPALNAAMLALASVGRAANLRDRNSSVDSYGREYNHESRPRANMFLARSASFFDISRSSSALTVMLVKPTGCRTYPLSEPSSSGLLA